MNTVLPLHPIPFEAWSYLLPLIILSVVAMLNLFLSPFIKKGRQAIFILSSLTLLSLTALSFNNIFKTGGSLLYEMLSYDRLSSFSAFAILIIGFMTFLNTWGNDLKDHLLAEIYALLFFALAGMLLLTSTTHLILIFISLEIMSLATYVMVAMKRSSRFASEASLKYFIMGGVASAFFLYGSSLIFGSLGTFDLAQMSSLMSVKNPNELTLVLLGSIMIFAAILFKVGAFPFHTWVPDVYQGAISPVTGFMAAAIKFASFVLFIRLCQNLFFAAGFPHPELIWSLMGIVALATMFYGNIVALRQWDLKRILSYSAIAHTGYLFLGLMAGRFSLEGHQAVIAYLVFYALSTLGVFAVISKLKLEGEKDLPLYRLHGLAKHQPFLATTLSLFLLSFAGIPLTAGFMGKYLLFISAISPVGIAIVVLTIIAALISLAYYMRIIGLMFMKEELPDAERHVLPQFLGTTTVIGFCACLTFFWGLFPEKVLALVKFIFILN